MICLVSDIHDNLLNFDRLAKQTKEWDIEELWIAGDAGTPETVKEIISQFSNPVRLVAGNVERDHQLARYRLLVKDHPNLVFTDAPPAVWQIQGYRICMTHQPKEFQSIDSGQEANLLISGHTHQPFLRRRGQAWHVNPGNLAGIFTPATFVLFDPGKFNLSLVRLS